jgi:hypothetical protein
MGPVLACPGPAERACAGKKSHTGIERASAHAAGTLFPLVVVVDRCIVIEP